MKAKIIVYMATAKNGVIGNSNNPPYCLPWKKLEGDLPRFKQETTGSPVIMGRKTAEIFGKPLPNRINIALSRDNLWKAPEGFITLRAMSQAIIRYEKGFEKIFIIGGAQILDEAIKAKIIDEMILTETYDDYLGDVYLPASFNKDEWKVNQRDQFPEFGYDVVHYLPKR